MFVDVILTSVIEPLSCVTSRAVQHYGCASVACWQVGVILCDLGHLDGIFRLVKAGRDPDAALFSFTAPELRRVFASLTARLGLQPLRPGLYSLRHGGASEDLNGGRRPALEVQLRGRWRTTASLRRYGKTTRLMTQLAKIDERVPRYGAMIQRGIVGFMNAACGIRGCALPPPPPQLR